MSVRLLMRLVCIALCMCSLVSCGSVNESLCKLLRFRPYCREYNCNEDYVNTSACGVRFDENGNVSFVSASRAATKYKHTGFFTADTSQLGALTTVKSLFLYESGLTSLDESIGSLTSLKYLFISQNSLRELPQSLGNLKELEVLYAFKNSLSEVPRTITNLTNLKKLDFNYNYGLMSVRASLKSLKNLTQLSIFSCSLKEVPDLAGMKNLRYLDLSFNHFTSIGMGVGDLSSLEVLDLSYASLTSLPDGISSLSSLKSLHIEHNNFGSSVTSSLLCLATKNIAAKITSDYECLNPDQAPSDLKSWYAKCKAYSIEDCEKCPLCEVLGSECKLRNPSGCPFNEKDISGSSGANAAVIAGATVGCILFVVIIIIIIIVIIVKRSRSGDNDDKTSKKKDIEMESLSFAGAVVPKDSSENIIDFDKLVLEEKVGEGSFGVVYKGKYGDSIVAIKKLKSIYSDEDKAEFKKECEILSQFRSPYVVEFIGVAESRDKLGIVTEFMALGSLESALAKKKDMFDPRFKTAVCLHVAEGMEYLHSNGILHRDLKPGNILICSFNPTSPSVCKITDFGSSRAAIKQTTMMNLTKGLGTPQYMAPEILEGSKQATFDFASSYDVYSYSIVAYETWTTEQAYSSLSLNHFELAEYVMAGKRPEIPKTIGPVIAEVIRQCWDQDPAKRPSFSEVVKKIKTIKK